MKGLTQLSVMYGCPRRINGNRGSHLTNVNIQNWAADNWVDAVVLLATSQTKWGWFN